MGGFGMKPHTSSVGYQVRNETTNFLLALQGSITAIVCFTLSCQGLKVTMKKHPSAFKLCGQLAEKLTTVGEEALTLYEGHSWGEKEGGGGRGKGKEEEEGGRRRGKWWWWGET